LAAARRAPHGRIIAIEPFPANVELLQKNITQNKLTNVAILVAAVTDQSGTSQLYVGNDTGMHSLKFNVGRGSVEVPAVRLEEVFDQYQIRICNFLKIDCEGAEFDFLFAIDPSLWRRIERVAMEFSVPILDWMFHNPSDEQVALKLQYGDQLVQLFERNGFQIDAYIDCVGFRAGYIFARNSNSLPRHTER
jgi:FkbM family methyltransferase